MKLKKIINLIKEFFKIVFLGKGGQEGYLQAKRIEEHKNEMFHKYYNYYPAIFKL